jgi:hypothetical protein
MPKVKLICNWSSSEEVIRLWDKQSQGGGRWEDLQLVPDEKSADYFVIINFPFAGEGFDPKRTIIFPMEPAHGRAGWGPWRDPSPRKFLRVMSHDKHYNNIEWHLSKTYRQLMEEPVKKSLVLSSVTSDLVAFEGQRKRVGFLQSLSDSGVPYDLFGRSNRFQIPNYRGPLPWVSKETGLMPYRYTFAGENCREHNYFTEKLIDAILAECLCFYWGCPNISDYIAPRAIIPVDLDRPQAAIETIREAIAENEWEKRIDVIRAEKKKILNELQFFPRLHRLLR